MSLRPVAVIALSGLLLASAQGAAHGEEPVAAKPPASCTGAGFNDFDFWLGEWDVYPAAKPEQTVGQNRIRKLDGGCALFESWRNIRGEPGHSLTYYLPDEGKWRQIWVAPPGYRIDISGGPTAAGTMRLEGTIFYYGRGEVPFRGTWTAQEDGSVRQLFEQYDADRKAWQVWFDGIYRRNDHP